MKESNFKIKCTVCGSEDVRILKRLTGDGPNIISLKCEECKLKTELL